MRAIKFLMFFALMMVLIANVSALEWDNVKTYDSTTREVTFKNSFLGIPTTEIGKARLNTPLNYKVAPGYQKVAEFDLYAYSDYNDILKSITFYDKNNNDWEKHEFSRDFDLKYKSYEEVLVEDFETQCYDSIDKKTLNETQICEQIKVGSHYEKQEVWTKVSPADLKKNEFLTIGLFTNVS